MQGLFALPKYENPTTMRGFFNNDHGRISNTAVLGEMYVDISEATKLTIGIRQDEFTVSNNSFSDLGDLGAGTLQDTKMLDYRNPSWWLPIVSWNNECCYK